MLHVQQRSKQLLLLRRNSQELGDFAGFVKLLSWIKEAVQCPHNTFAKNSYAFHFTSTKILPNLISTEY